MSPHEHDELAGVQMPRLELSSFSDFFEKAPDCYLTYDDRDMIRTGIGGRSYVILAWGRLWFLFASGLVLTGYLQLMDSALEFATVVLICFACIVSLA